MLSIDLGSAEGREVLALGAHGDDIEIGCGGAMLRLAANSANAITWIVFASDPGRAEEARSSARAFLGDAPNRRIEVLDFRDGFLPWNGAAVKERFEDLKREHSPDLVFTHFRADLHQDHRLVNELTWNTFRDHLVLEYETPKWDGDLGRPNAYFALTEAEIAAKAARLLDCYPSQAGKDWFTEDLFRGLARVRGMECRSPSGFAEAFTLRKLALDL